MEALTISAANLDTIEQSMLALNSNINYVASDMVNISGKVETVTDSVKEMQTEVKSLESEIRDFMFEIKGSTLVSNAQNDILLKQNELNQKYGNNKAIRTKLFGIITNSKITKDIFVSEANKSLVNAGDYYLSYVLNAIINWFLNNKENAEKHLASALKINPEKTALVLFLVSLKHNRQKAAYRWLKFYLSKQSTNSVNGDFLILLEAISLGYFDSNATQKILKVLNNWTQNININSQECEKCINIWHEFIDGNIEQNSQKEFPLIIQNVSNYETLFKRLDNARSYNNVYNAIRGKINGQEIEIKKSLDELIKDILMSTDGNEFELQRAILKDQLIINNKGNISDANKEYETTSIALSEKTDFYSLLTDAILNRDDVYSGTKKLAISLLKPIISKSINDCFESDNDLNKEIAINIGNWTGSTTIGNNEEELVKSYHEYSFNSHKKEIDSFSFLNIKIILPFLLAIGSLIMTFVYFLPGLILMFICIFVGIFFLYDIMKKKSLYINELNETIAGNEEYLKDIISEIVDVYFIKKRSQKDLEQINNYLDGFNTNNYVVSGENYE